MWKMEEMVQLFPGVRVSKSIADWVRLMPWGDFIDDSGTLEYWFTEQLKYLRATGVEIPFEYTISRKFAGELDEILIRSYYPGFATTEITPGLNISDKFARELEQILDNKGGRHKGNSLSEDWGIYPIETSSEPHLREKDRRAERIQQNYKHNEREYERSLHLPKLKGTKPEPLKYPCRLTEPDMGKYYATANNGGGNHTSEYPSIFKMPVLMTDTSSWMIEDHKNHKPNMDLTMTSEYRLQLVGSKLGIRADYTPNRN